MNTYKNSIGLEPNARGCCFTPDEKYTRLDSIIKTLQQGQP